MPKIPLSLILTLARELLKIISPELRQIIEHLLKELEAKADATPNPWDNIFVALLKSLLDIE